MMTLAQIATWFMTSKIGRAVAAGAALAVAIGVAVLKVFSAGKAAERAREDQASLDNLRSRAKTNDEVHSLGADDVERRLNRWVSDDER